MTYDSSLLSSLENVMKRSSIVAQSATDRSEQSSTERVSYCVPVSVSDPM